MGNGYSISHVRCGIRHSRGSVSSYVAFEGRAFKWADISMRCINESYQKIWARICWVRTTGPRLIQANLIYKSQAFFRRNRLGGGQVGGAEVHCPTPLHDDQEKNSVVRFHGFLPKMMTSWVCGSYLRSTKWPQVNVSRISRSTK